jgi:hypothetical protein
MLDPWSPPLQIVSITVNLANGSLTFKRDSLRNVGSGVSGTDSVFSKSTAVIDSNYPVPELEVENLRTYSLLAGTMTR